VRPPGQRVNEQAANKIQEAAPAGNGAVGLEQIDKQSETLKKQ